MTNSYMELQIKIWLTYQLFVELNNQLYELPALIWVTYHRLVIFFLSLTFSNSFKRLSTQISVTH